MYSGEVNGRVESSDNEYDPRASQSNKTKTTDVSSAAAAVAVVTTSAKRYDNRPITQQQIILSSSSSSASSISSSASRSPLPPPTTTVTLQLPPLPHAPVNSNHKRSHTPVERMPPVGLDTSNKQFTEVSYEFLGDLSMCSSIAAGGAGGTNGNTPKLAHSKSFSKFIAPAPAAAAKTPQINNHTFINPFRRTSVSKSFSAFTSRLKMQQQQQLKHHQAIKVNERLVVDSTPITTKTEDETTTRLNKQLNELNLVNTASTSSSLSSPTLSTCSNSSMSSGSASKTTNDESITAEEVVISL